MGRHTEPEPKMTASIATKAQWRATSVLELEWNEYQPLRSFDSVFGRRRTTREIDPLPLAKLCAFIKYVFGPREVGQRVTSGRIRKPMISAGALHPIEVIVVAGPEIVEPLIYSDFSSQFLFLPVTDQHRLDIAVKRANNILPEANGYLLLFVGNRAHILQAYQSPDSLLWRDAGAALQAAAMSAEACDLAFAPLGYTGTDILECLCPPSQAYIATGLAILGAKRAQ